MRMKLNLHDRIPRLIYFLNCHEPNETSVVRRIVQPDWTVLDVGAHIGYYTLLMARLLDRCRGRVYAFEPNPETFAILKEHVEMNELTHVTALNLALGASVGYAELYLGPSHHSGPASMFPPACAEKRVAAEVSTLEEFVADSKLNRLDFIKMDVNGAEPDVLRGGREALAFYRPRMLMEVNPPMLAQSGRRPRDLLLLLRDLGYAVFRTDRPRSEITLSESGRLGYMYVYCEPR
jgi:FkbM family methyltransferase